MAISIPRALVEFVLLGPSHDRRQLQDSPILGDVWIAYAEAPGQAQELLLAPHRDHTAGEVAGVIDELLQQSPPVDDADIAPLHGIVAARLTFDQLARFVVPMTAWWQSDRIKKQLEAYADTAESPPPTRSEAPSERDRDIAGRLNRMAEAILVLARDWKPGFEGQLDEDLLPAFDRYLALAGLILLAGRHGGEAADASPPSGAGLSAALANVAESDIVALMVDLLEATRSQKDALIWQVSLNRTATPALERSVPAVKADAARRLFGVDCSKITWAVVDSGIQGDHPAFHTQGGKRRVLRSFDFSNIRKIVSLDNLRRADARVDELLHGALLTPPDREKAIEYLQELAKDAKNQRPPRWDLIQHFVEIKPESRPSTSDHGTHVAGIIGACAKGVVKAPEGASQPAEGDAPEAEGAAPAPGSVDSDAVDGMCPDIQLYDFRVLASRIQETEFAIIAALQYIRFLNARTDYTTIHGANLSLSIPHDVRNYACGRTPVCMECERLVESGVMVVAAAGNHGYQNFQTREGSFEGYAAFSVTDPGNADGVLTVGATHRFAPHTYGVSFFSSRGPTGDGRLKPDLVAPGERIRGPFRVGWGDLDGTSMAAPHASGAAAMLMARYSELVGQPRRIKSILCESATDLGRERSFQGNGMLDVLRAFQSI